MADQKNRRFVLAKRPEANIDEQTLRWTEGPMPEPAEEEVLLQNLWLSIDPTNRTWMNAQATYLPPIPLGETMRGLTVGRVLRSRCRDIEEGALVSAMGGFSEYAAVKGRAVTPLPEGVAPTDALSVLGHIGLTAYFGLVDVGRPQSGDTVLVSGAAGATGSLVGQIAKNLGCRVVGTAGSDSKCKWLTEELGFDAAINYRTTGNLGKAVKDACPDGVNVFFDNVGGPILDAALANLALMGTVVLCGAISQYNAEKPLGPSNYMALISQRGRMEGFIVLDYLPRVLEAMAVLLPWIRDGKLKNELHIIEGLENAPSALKMLFTGDNRGKLLVKIAP